jgi:hypothetical protein
MAVMKLIRRGTLALLAISLAAAVVPVHAAGLQELLASKERRSFNLIHVRVLAGLMTADRAKVYVFDADPADVRESEGIIPGAHLLPSSESYDVATELPADKNSKLVFYCHNLH